MPVPTAGVEKLDDEQLVRRVRDRVRYKHSDRSIL